MGKNEAQLVELWKGIVPVERVRHCLRILREASGRPLELLQEARITYLAGRRSLHDAARRLDGYSLFDIGF